MIFLTKSRRSPLRRIRPLQLESLEGRLVLDASGQITLTNLVALDPQNVVASYDVPADLSSSSPQSITIDVYRGASATSKDFLVGQAPADLTVGTHDTTIHLNAPLAIDPAENYVVAGTSDTTDSSVASFRIWTIGIVAHGYQSTGQLPAWPSQMANGLTTVAHYDAATFIDWAQASALPQPGVTTAVAQQVVQEVNTLVAGLSNNSGPAPNDMVDVHLIGHSRGTVVMSQAAQLLANLSSTEPQPVDRGFLKLTLLDPHPATNTVIPEYSSSTGPLGRLAVQLYTTFQAGANDPAITISPRVNATEVFYQRAPVYAALLPEEQFMNNWGNVPVNLAPGVATNTVTYYNLAQLVPSHEGVHDFYIQTIVPTLATGGVVPLPPVPTPNPATGGGPAFATQGQGNTYELTLLRKTGVRAPVARVLLAKVAVLDHLVARNAPQRVVSRQLDILTRFVTVRAGRTIPTPVAQLLLGTFGVARFLLVG